MARNFSYRKNKLALKFAFQIRREIDTSLQHMLDSGIYTKKQEFYIKLGIELALSDVYTTIGANNSAPKMGSKWYLHSPRV